MLTYNGIELSGAGYNTDALSSLTYNGDETLEPINLLIGDNFIVTDFATAGSSQGVKNGCGFVISLDSSSLPVSGVFDGNPSTGSILVSKSTATTTSTAHIMIGFPFPVILQSVTIIDCDDTGDCVQYNTSTSISSKKGFATGKLYFSTREETSFFAGSDYAAANTLDSNGRGTYITFGTGSRTNYTRSVCRNANWNNTEVRAVDLKMTAWKASDKKQYEAEMKLDVLVKPSVYNAWKRQYASELAGARIV